MASGRMQTRHEVSAGGVVYRVDRGEPSVCLIATQGHTAWQLPKGLIERDERAEDAARREVEEETGLRGELLSRLERIEYWYVWNEDGERTRIHKLVYFFLFRYTGGSTEDHDHEVDEARWFPLPEALDTLSFENERRVMRIAGEAIASRR